MKKKEALLTFLLLTSGPTLACQTVNIIAGRLQPAVAATETATATARARIRATFTPAPTRTVTRSLEIPGAGRIIPDSVYPGGINTVSGFTLEEAQTVADIYNGTSSRVSEQVNKRLNAARAYAESVFGVKGKIDGGTLLAKKGLGNEVSVGAARFSRTSDGYFDAQGTGPGGERLYFRLFEVRTPGGYRFNQIAVHDNNPGVAYANNRAVVDNELLYVVEVRNVAGEAVTVVDFRGACGNIGGEAPLPVPTPGATATPQRTPTPFSEISPTPTLPRRDTATPPPPPPPPPLPTRTPEQPRTPTPMPPQPPKEIPTATPGNTYPTPMKTPVPPTQVP